MTKYEYTWVFTKGARTYLNAYHVIDHSSSMVEIFLDRYNSHLYIGDQKGLTLYEIGEPRIVLHYIDKSLVGKEEELVIFAESTDPHSNKTFKCQ